MTEITKLFKQYSLMEPMEFSLKSDTLLKSFSMISKAILVLVKTTKEKSGLNACFYGRDVVDFLSKLIG